MKKFLVGVYDARGYDLEDNLLFVGKTLLNTSVETTLQNVDVRGGKGNQLQYIFYHSAETNITIEDTQFNLEFLALNVGSQIQQGEDLFLTETVAITNGSGVVTKGTPLSLSTTNIYGWVTLPDGEVERVTFTGSNFQLQDNAFNGNVCIRYYANNMNARSITLYADMMPSVIRLELEGTLASSDSTTNKIGTTQIIFNRASATGAFTLSSTADNVANTALTLRALADDSMLNTGGCEDNRAIYGKIIEYIDSLNWYDNVVGLAIDGGALSLAATASKTLNVYGVTKNSSFLIPASNLTFATEDANTATVTAGVVTGVAAGSTSITITIPEKTSVNLSVDVEVTA